MLVHVYSQACALVKSTPTELEWLKSILKVEDKKALESSKYRDPVSRGVNPDMDLSWRDPSGRICFPPGILPIVRRAADKVKIQIEVDDCRVYPSDQPENIESALDNLVWQMETGPAARTPRDYQLGAIKAVKYGTSPDVDIEYPLPGRGIIKSPTGSGKGDIAACIPFVYPGNWVFCVHRSHLARDVADRYKKYFGKEPGWIGEGIWDPREGLTCATIQTLFSMMGQKKFKEWASTVIGVELDECHTAAAETHSGVAAAFPNAYYKIGLSGTPLDRTDKRSILAVSAIGPIIYEVKSVELIERKIIAEPEVRIIPCWQPNYIGPWAEIYDARIKNSAHRNGAIVAAMVASEAPGIVFVRHLDHGKEICRLAQRKGMDVDFVHGSWSLEKRQRVIKQLDLGVLQWVVASSVFSEGVDIPCLRTVINGGGGKSIIQTLQQVGRGTRISTDKDKFVVWDIGDSGTACLHKHAKERVAACQREGYKCVIFDKLWPKKATKEDYA